MNVTQDLELVDRVSVLRAADRRARVPVSRTYRPLVPAGTGMFSVPPAPDVVQYTWVQVAASLDTSMWYAVANAASHLMREAADVGARAEVELQPLRVAPGG